MGKIANIDTFQMNTKLHLLKFIMCTHSVSSRELHSLIIYNVHTAEVHGVKGN